MGGEGMGGDGWRGEGRGWVERGGMGGEGRGVNESERRLNDLKGSDERVKEERLRRKNCVM